MNQQQTTPSLFFPNLNGLRFAGALAVMLFHCFTLHRDIWGDFYNTQWFKAIGLVLNKGHLGVALFFVLSGFLITYLLLNELARNGSINLGHYFMRRILRVWPLYFVITLFGFFIFPHLPYGVETVHELWRYLIFASNIDEIILGLKDNINFLTATWTISVEEQFYLSWGIFIALLRFRNKNTFLWFFLSVIAGTIVFRLFHLNDERTLYFHTFSVISDLAFGGLIAWLVYYKKLSSFFEELPRWIILLAYLIGGALLLSEGKLLSGSVVSFARLIPETVFAFIILEQVYAKHSFYKIDRIPGFFEAGKLTYGFYLFHCIYIWYWAHFFKDHQLTSNFGYYGLYVVLVFVSTYATAWLSFRYFEQPFLRLKRFFRA
jgi:peptidoglycan/LPS O-acetylase OafA/YrhL